MWVWREHRQPTAVSSRPRRATGEVMGLGTGEPLNVVAFVFNMIFEFQIRVIRFSVIVYLPTGLLNSWKSLHLVWPPWESLPLRGRVSPCRR